VCVCALSLRRKSPDMILGDKPLISEVILSQGGCAARRAMDAEVDAGVRRRRRHRYPEPVGDKLLGREQLEPMETHHCVWVSDLGGHGWR
jgi:hypothetical protein